MKIDALSQLFVAIFVLSLLTWAAKYFFVLFYNRRKREEINKLEARTAALRMLLKAKLKRKGSQMQAQYKDEQEFVASLSSKLELLTTYNFTRTTDYEDVVGLLGAISESIDLHTVQKNPGYYMAQQAQIQEEREKILLEAGAEVKKTEAKAQTREMLEKTSSEVSAVVPQFERWSQLLKYDKGNMYIIKEIVETTMDLKNKIEIFNLEQEKKENHLRAPELITIKGFEGLRAVIDRDRARIAEGKEARKLKRKEELLNPDLSDSPERVAMAAGDDQNVA